MKVLMIGGTGIISTYVLKKCLAIGMDVTIMNRGTRPQAHAKNMTVMKGDIHQEADVAALLKGKSYDAVIEFVAYTRTHVERDLRLFKGHTAQYIFISTASVYHKPVEQTPMTEQTPLHNPYWPYSQDKIACEEALNAREEIPVTIVRPAHTYNNTMIMAMVAKWQYEYAHLKRLIEGKPIIVAGDGTSLWTLTHAADFANSFVDLIGNQAAYHETYHITSEKWYTWDQLTHLTAAALGVKAEIIHIPSDVICAHLPEMVGPLLGDKAHSAIFDNTKIKALSKHYTSQIGYEAVVDDVIKYYANQPALQRVSPDFEKQYDTLIERFRALI